MENIGKHFSKLFNSCGCRKDESEKNMEEEEN